MSDRLCFNCFHKKTPDGPCPHCGFDCAKYRQPEFALPPGAQLHAGKYLVGKVLGQGGFGITYVGLDQSLELRVAVKEYFPTHMASRAGGTSALSWHASVMDRDSGREGFVKEARKMAKIHRIPNVVEVRDVFYENDTAYIVMDFVAGETLKDRLIRTGPMDAERCIQTLRPVMESLGMAHERGLIHRDVSPDNIMLDPAGTVWLLDMGAAKDIDVQAGDRTQSSQMVVKHGFSPPEQSASAGSIGPWTDVYAMCATIYYCVTGKLTPDAVDRLMGAPLEMPAAIPQNLAAALERGLALRPEERIRSMEELMEALDGVIREQKVKTKKKEKKKKTEEKKETKEKKERIQIPLAERLRTLPKAVKLGVPAALCALLALLLLPEVMRTWGFKYELHRGHAVITGYFGKSESVDIPSKIWGKPVTTISPAAFLTHPNSTSAVRLSSVTIPESVTDIGSYAFGYTNLATVKIPAGVRSIGQGAFAACSRLTDIEVADGNRVYKDVDGVLFGRDMTSLFCYPAGRRDETYLVPDGVLEIGNAAFEGCGNLHEIDLPDSVVSIRQQAFWACHGLESVSLPDSVERIDKDAFASCGRLSSAIVPLGVSISEDSFEQTTEVIRVGEALESGECGGNAEWTFYDNGAFIVSGTGPMTDYTYGYTGHPYESNMPWWDLREEILSVYILEGITTLGEASFVFCENMTGISLPDSLTAIGERALFRCDLLADMAIPGGVTEIGAFAFDGVMITEVVVPPGVTVIERGVFYECYGLTDVYLPNGVTEIGQRAFFGCDSLRNITIPDSIRSIGESAFFACDGLTNVYFGGTEEQWKALARSSWDAELTGAQIHFSKS